MDQNSGLPTFVGGTNSSVAIRTMAIIEQWYTQVIVNTHDIEACLNILMKLIRTSDRNACNPQENMIRLPVAFAPRNMGIFISKGLENLVTVDPPVPTETEQCIVLSLTEELNSMFLLKLSGNVSFDQRFKTEDKILNRIVY